MNARRLHHCRGCKRDTAQILVCVENGDRPPAETFSCIACGLQILKLANVHDAEGLCIHVVTKATRGASNRFTRDVREEATQELYARIWEVYKRWDPARNASFRSYATWKLGALLVDWERERVGRDGRVKPLAVALSLDSASFGWAGADADVLAAQRGDGDGDDDLGHRREGLGGSVGAGHGDPAEDRAPALVGALLRRDRGASVASQLQEDLGVLGLCQDA